MKQALLISLLLSACGQAVTQPQIASTSTAAFFETISATQTQVGSETSNPASTDHQRPVYSIQATLDYGAHYLAVTEQITYTNNSGSGLDKIPLIVEADEFGAVFDLTSLEFDRGSEVDYGTHRGISVTLARTLEPGEQVTLNLEYSLALPETASSLSWTERQTNFVDWYPFIPPNIDGSWRINPKAIQGEHLAYESADFDVQLTIVNAPALTRIAAPALATELGTNDFSYHLESARRFSWSVGGNYQVESMNSENGIPVAVYFYEEDRNAAEASLHAAADAIGVYSQLFSPYPYESLSIVECSFPDGMESDGLFFLDMSYFRSYNYKTTNLLTTLTAHETAHNWWYGSIGNDPANEPWLDEAFATYSERLFYENVYPNDVKWWFDFRVNQWEPSGWVDSTIYELPNFRPYVNAVYLRGVLFLEELRHAIGNETFLAFLQEYAQQGTGRIVSNEEFFWRLAYAAEDKVRDLDPILNEYFRLADQ
jgi:peptidase M1-like protein